MTSDDLLGDKGRNFQSLLIMGGGVIGVEFASMQCQQLIENGVKGLHFFTLNTSTAVSKIFLKFTFLSIVKGGKAGKSKSQKQECFR